MSDSALDVEQSLKSLQDEYVHQLPVKIRAIVFEWSILSEQAWDPLRLDSVYRLVHNVAGSATTFGLAQVSEAAIELETLLASGRDDDFLPSPLYIDSVQAAVLHLVNVSRKARAIALDASALVSAQNKTPDVNLVYLLANDEAESIITQLGYFGYEVRHFERFDTIIQALHEQPPVAMVMDIELPEGNSAEMLAAMDRDTTGNVPVMFTAARDDIATRLASVRAGGVAFLPKPLDVSALIDVLDRVAGRKQEQTHRILIVDDSATLANFYKLTLEQADMEALVVINPMEALKHLHEFNPDLILMDMYMPGCTGDELAKVIRQFKVFLSIPIVFLSAEKNLERQQEAMSLGGDDFLTKPIKPDYLVSAVSSRVRRARSLRSIMYRDSLTGLLNHTESKKQLDMQLSRAQRDKSPLVLAMLDIDHFKLVNDNYGHPVGDRVIRSLALLLQQRLRKSDIIGRYGGEEFVAILPDTPIEEAVNILDRLRNAFSKVAYQTPQGSFHSTFSCGLAAYPDFDSLELLFEQADQALYRAKKGGRNRVECAGCDS